MRTWARIYTVDSTTLAWESSYDPALVASFKSSVPTPMRRWDSTRKRWLIDASYAQMVVDLSRDHLGIACQVPAMASAVSPPVEVRLVFLEYLGRTKQQLDGEAFASGWCDGAWSLCFSERCLRDWFEAMPDIPGEAPTLYGVLGIVPTSTGDEIKSAYRRLARVWHPDVSKDADAHEQFLAIGNAYEALADPIKRRRYDIGLRMEAEAAAQIGQRSPREFGMGGYGNYRAPLTCGVLAVEGVSRLGQFWVAKIVQWEDAVNPAGETMVSSWPAGADQFEVEWR